MRRGKDQVDIGRWARLADYLSASLLARVVPAQVVHEVLDAHQCNSQRLRSFPAVAGVYYCMALSLYPEAAWFFSETPRIVDMHATPTHSRTLARHLKLGAMLLLACMWASVSHAEDEETNCYQRTPAMAQKESRLHPNVRRKADTLVIHTTGKTVRLQDKIGSKVPLEEPYCYLYQAFLPKVQLHVFLLQWGLEYFDYAVVHAQSGEKAQILGWPRVSPDAKKFASIFLDNSTHSVAASIEIWRVKQGKFTRELAFAPPDDWYPEEAEWLDSNTVKFVGTCGKGGPEDRQPPNLCPVLTARFKNGAWQINGSSQQSP